MFSFFKKTVDDIIADITAKIEHLHVVAEAHADAARVHNEVVVLHTKLAVAADDEFARAKRIAGKFTELLS